MSLEMLKQDAKEVLREWMNMKTTLRIAAFASDVDGEDVERLRMVLKQLSNNGKHAILLANDLCPELNSLDFPELLFSFLMDLYDRAIYSAHLIVGINYKENAAVPFILGYAVAQRKPTLLLGNPLSGGPSFVKIDGYCDNTSDVQRFIDQYNERTNIVQTEVRLRATLALFRSSR